MVFVIHLSSLPLVTPHLSVHAIRVNHDIIGVVVNIEHRTVAHVAVVQVLEWFLVVNRARLIVVVVVHVPLQVHVSVGRYHHHRPNRVHFGLWLALLQKRQRDKNIKRSLTIQKVKNNNTCMSLEMTLRLNSLLTLDLLLFFLFFPSSHF